MAHCYRENVCKIPTRKIQRLYVWHGIYGSQEWFTNRVIPHYLQMYSKLSETSALKILK